MDTMKNMVDATLEVPEPQSAALSAISEDTLKYLRDKRVPETLEYVLRGIMRDRPTNPVEYISKLTSTPLPPHIILTGPPGSGVDLQCRKLCAYFKRTTGRLPVHVSSGELLRHEVQEDTILGKIAKTYMDNHQLVPDNLVIGLIRQRLREDDVLMNGWVLEGFPRNRAQAIVLDKIGYSPDSLIFIDTPDDITLERVLGLRYDPKTDTLYHIKFHPPPEDDEAVMDRLVQRPEDTREAILPRLQDFRERVEGLLEFYAPVTEHILGDRDELEVTKDIITSVDKIFIKGNHV